MPSGALVFNADGIAASDGANVIGLFVSILLLGAGLLVAKGYKRAR